MRSGLFPYPRPTQNPSALKDLKNAIAFQVGPHSLIYVTFEWDAKKAAANLAKHGVAFDDARRAFEDPRALVAFDEEHSTLRELRWWLLGKVDGRVMLVRYAHRPHGSIRIIGAGFWRIGKEIYEKTHSQA
jgi:uncharacterized DUF497 family protein